MSEGNHLLPVRPDGIQTGGLIFMPKGLHLRAKDDHLEGQVEATYTRGPTISSRGDRNIIHIQGIIFLQSSLLNFCFAVLSIPE